MESELLRQVIVLLTSIDDKLTVKPKARRERITPTTVTDSGFEQFWLAYPKKVGRGAAEQAWAKIKPGTDQILVMVKAVKAQARSEKWTKDGGQFIPNPATWLNEKRWMDEVAVKVSYQQPPVMMKKTESLPEGVGPDEKARAALSKLFGGDFMKHMGGA